MKKLVKPIAIILLGAYSFALGQDVYPYFSNSKKQFEFEKKRIYIKEVSENKQIISGGSEFNIMRLFDDSAPLTIPAPVRTTYNYKYEFHILQNGKNLTEVEFLRLIGLKEEAEEILNDFSSKIIIWEKTPSIEVIQRHKDEAFTGCGYIGLIVGGLFLLNPTECYEAGSVPSGGYVEAGCNSTKGLGLAFGLFGLIWVSMGKEKTAFIKPSKPELEQTLSNEQIKSLSESYNKRIYEEIKNAN